ncbi:hypothetical protein GCM10008111_01770 [Alishewanella tabrizica]|uniref:VWFA domain-containing protein n=2 Tax=Alishewanella tabrizica TaxID=671278 RepID=A0ABQ2WF86_9ALTE|nr:hypothetical protein GCM10008111_01770 [Alishewanella tabrizica]
MRLRRRPEDGFNMSFLDVMACGLGAIILIFILVDFHAFQPEPTDETNKLQQELNAAAHQREQLQKAIDELNDKIALESSTQQDSRSSQADTSSTQSKLLQQISTELAVVADLENQIAALAKQPVPDANIQLSGSGQQRYLTGLKVEGREIGILLDKSASMMGENLLDILRFMALSDAQKVSQPKWQRTRRTAQWLLARAPQESNITLVAFSEDAIVLGNRPASSPKVTDSMRAMVRDVGKLVPQGGTNLQVGLQKLREVHPNVTDVYIITDGLPTLGDGLGARCRGVLTSKKTISSQCRQELLIETVKRAGQGFRVHVILLPLEGDPYASSMYWSWTQVTGGTFLAPAGEWP